MTNIHLQPLQNNSDQHDSIVLIVQKFNVVQNPASTVKFEHVRVTKFLMVLPT